MTICSRSIHLLLRVAPILVIWVLIFEDALFAQSISDRVLSRSQINEDASCAALTIYFNIPVRYVSHFPVQRGDELRVRFAPISAVPGASGFLGKRESLRPPNSRRASVRRIEFEGDRPEGATLSIYFDRPVNYGVLQGDDFRSIVVTISGDAPLSACRGAPAATPGIVTRPAKPAAPLALYALNLMSSERPIAVSDLPHAAVFQGYTLYTTRFETNGQVWYRLRLGFFASREEAQRSADRFVPYFGKPWVTQVTPYEREQALANPIFASRRKTLKKAPVPKLPPAELTKEDRKIVSDSGIAKEASALTEEDRKLLDDARTALHKEDYPLAIRLLTKLRQTPGGRTVPAAAELLGAARERNRQLAHAKAEYEGYLREFPNAEGAARVRQRLAALLSVGKTPQQKLRTAKASLRKTRTKWRLHGSVSQTYTRDETSRAFVLPGEVDPTEETLLRQNQLLSVAYINAGFSNDRHEAGIRFSGSYTNDFREEADGDDQSVSSAYLDLADNEWNMNLRMGRQPRSSGGILGRFDGGLLGFRLQDKVKINLAGGYPVLTPRDTEINDERYFYGASADIEQLLKGLETTWYYIKQFVSGLTDREAIGLETRYASGRRTAFATIDYDLFYGELNLALFNGTWIFADNATISLSLDYRKAPLLTTFNALLGQGLPEFPALTDLYTEEEIHQLAQDRTATSRTASIAFSKPLTKRLQVNANVLVADISDTPASGGVIATPGSGPDYFVSTQLIGSSVLKDGDIGIVGFRYQNMTTSDRYFIDLNGRYPVTKRFRINPRFRVGYRQDKEIDFTQLSYKPSIRFDFYATRNFVLELEVGAEWLTDVLPAGDEKTSSQFVNASYRMDF